MPCPVSSLCLRHRLLRYSQRERVRKRNPNPTEYRGQYRSVCLLSSGDGGVVQGRLRRAHRAAADGLAGDRARRECADPGAHRHGQDAGGVPVVPGPADAGSREQDESGNRGSGTRDRTRARRGRGCRIVYVSPLKALAVDVERNLRSPLAGMANMARRMGVAFHEPTISVRTGDTPQRERARFARHPADILITTPESLYLLLTSQAAEALRTVDTVIVDEIHALVPTKRGAHLALTLERLEALTAKPLQRIGLSATQRPLEEVARFLGGVEVQGRGTQGAGSQKVSESSEVSAIAASPQSQEFDRARLQACDRVPRSLFPVPWLGRCRAAALPPRHHRQRQRAQAAQAAH